uniref:Uncharacterized protein n=1 Tax=Candidatus Kentrum sp. LPFa TaxID=2126335 RepID=A0A450WCC6_9GAMM|nr:MAG: hypothetical protein BECKLPF1236B_GA0070989_106611 [Candidatus Kentron sp. LPFa]
MLARSNRIQTGCSLRRHQFFRNFCFSDTLNEEHPPSCLNRDNEKEGEIYAFSLWNVKREFSSVICLAKPRWNSTYVPRNRYAVVPLSGRMICDFMGGTGKTDNPDARESIAREAVPYSRPANSFISRAFSHVRQVYRNTNFILPIALSARGEASPGEVKCNVYHNAANNHGAASGQRRTKDEYDH